MPSYNKVTLIGHLTRDPETRFFANDNNVANFGLAINRKYTASNGERKEDVTFVDVEAWGKTADIIAKYTSKGDAIFVEGRLKLDQWETQEGARRSKLKVVCENIQFMSKRGDGADKTSHNHAGAETPTRPPRSEVGPAADNEPPF